MLIILCVNSLCSVISDIMRINMKQNCYVKTDGVFMSSYISVNKQPTFSKEFTHSSV